MLENTMKNLPRLALLFVLGAAFSGCSDEAVHYPVAGKVTLDGEPVASGEIIFSSSAGPVDAGPINDGEFSFESLQGAMRVEVTAVRDHPTRKVPGSTPDVWLPAKVNFIPERYRGPTSELQIEIPRGGNQEIEFNLRSDEASSHSDISLPRRRDTCVAHTHFVTCIVDLRRDDFKDYSMKKLLRDTTGRKSGRGD